mgnify:CR=1 FL=1
MSGGIAQLVAVGAQDAHLVGDPEVSFFRSTYKRHTNFSQTVERQVIQGNLSQGGMSSVRFERKGDLLGYVYLTSIASNATENLDWSTVIDKVELLVGGQVIDEQDVFFTDNIAPDLLATGLAKSAAGSLYNGGSSKFYPLRFSFCENWQSALPLVALQYHDVELRIKCRDGYTPVGTPKVYGNYIYLDTDERKFFTDNEHEILFTQTQYQPATNTDVDLDLTYFNHPVKSLHLVSGNATLNNWDDEYTFQKSSLYINGVALFEETSNVYHHNVVPEMHCTDLPDDVLDDLPTFTWPFCLTMSKMQPTGTLNFSRIDNAKLSLVGPTGGNQLHRIYAVNYNILRIKNGMAGVAFGN